MKVFVDTKTIKKYADEIDKINRLDIDDYIKNIDEIVDDLEDLWQGSDADYFQKTIFPYIYDLKEFKRSVDSYYDYISDYVKCVNDLYNKYKEKDITLE